MRKIHEIVKNKHEKEVVINMNIPRQSKLN